MTTLFKDTFTGSGTLNGHVPNTTFNSYAWSCPSSDFSLSGGQLVSAASDFNAATIGAETGYSGTGNGGADQILAFDFTTGGTLTGVDDVFFLRIRFGSYYQYQFYVRNLGSGWEMRLGNASGSAGEVLIEGGFSLSANATYPVTLTFKTNGDVVFSAVGMSGTCTLASAASYVSAGLKWMFVSLSNTWKVGEIWMADSFSATATATLSAPFVTTSIAGTVGAPPGASAAATLVCPRQTLAMQATAPERAVASLLAPSPTLSATAHDASSDRYANLTAPLQSLVVFGGATAQPTAPLQALSATGKASIMASALVMAPSPTLVSAAKVAAMASVTLKGPVQSLVGFSGAMCSISISGGPILQASGKVGGVGYATITAPLFELTAGATKQNGGSAVLMAPSPRMATTGAAWVLAPGARLTAIGTAVVAISYEAYALNLKHANPDSVDELTRYTNYPFDRIVRYQNSYFGMNSTGLYLLEGTTDFSEPAPTPVPWAFKTAMTDFELPNLKTVNWAYFGGRMGPAATVSIHYGDTGEQNYAYTTPRGASAQNYRQPFGRGIKSRYYAFEAEGDGELSLDSLMFDIAKSARKV